MKLHEYQSKDLLSKFGVLGETLPGLGHLAIGGLAFVHAMGTLINEFTTETKIPLGRAPLNRHATGKVTPAAVAGGPPEPTGAAPSPPRPCGTGSPAPAASPGRRSTGSARGWPPRWRPPTCS